MLLTSGISVASSVVGISASVVVGSGVLGAAGGTNSNGGGP